MTLKRTLFFFLKKQFLDKSCINYAAVIGFKEDLKINGSQYSLIGSIFYLGYLLFQVIILFSKHTMFKKRAKKLMLFFSFLKVTKQLLSSKNPSWKISWNYHHFMGCCLDVYSSCN